MHSQPSSTVDLIQRIAYEQGIKALARREPHEQVVDNAIAQGLNLSRLGYIKWLIVEGRLHD